MGEIKHRIMTGKVMHKRLFPRENSFTYGIYYLALRLKFLKQLQIALNCFSYFSFYERDHGPCDGSSLDLWARSILSDYDLSDSVEDIELICMPRVLGYVFNPVSFWLCFDSEKNLRAVLCEVHNTFGERHTYVCAHKDHRVISNTDILKGEKVFHVSPFLKREGNYEFRFVYDAERFAAFIDYFDNTGKKQLITSLSGKFSELSKTNVLKAFFRYPLVTFKAVYLIHWQAMKLLLKKIRFISKPAQIDRHITPSNDLTKN